MSDNIRTALYDAEYTVRAGLARVRRRAGADPRRRQALRERRHRRQGRWLPADLAPGDLLAVAATGRLLPGDGLQLQPRRRARRWSRSRDGRAASLLRRETLDDLLALDAGLSQPSLGAPRADRPATAGTVGSRRTVRRREREPVMGAQPLRVALLGCGVVGSRGGPAAARARPTTSPPGIGAPLELVGRRRARPRRRDRGPARPARPAHRRPGRARRPARRRRRRRGDRRHRAGPLAAPRRRWSRGASVVTANKALLAEDGADAVRRRRRSRRRPLLRGGRRRRDPAAAPAARVARRRQGQPGARHRQRHHQLHPHQDGRGRRRLRRRARRGAGARATPRPTRPPTSRATTPPPRPRSSPAWPSTPG